MCCRGIDLGFKMILIGWYNGVKKVNFLFIIFKRKVIKIGRFFFLIFLVLKFDVN